MVDTRESNADAHPGLVVLASQQKRHTKQQILADKANAKAVAVATRRAILAREHELLEHIGLIEDTIQQEDDVLQAHANRPDLCHGSEPSSQKRSRTMSKHNIATPSKKKKLGEEDYK
jgi:hypothetical protein